MTDYYENNSGYKSGDRVRAFDFLLWRKNGGDTKTNREFTLPATIVKVYREKKSNTSHRLRMLADLKFDHKDRVSHGHFLYAFSAL